MLCKHRELGRETICCSFITADKRMLRVKGLQFLETSVISNLSIFKSSAYVVLPSCPGCVCFSGAGWIAQQSYQTC